MKKISLAMMKQLMKHLAIPLSNPKTVAKRLVIAIRLGDQKALHSHSAKSPKDGDVSRRLTIAKSLVILLMVAPTFAHAWWPWTRVTRSVSSRRKAMIRRIRACIRSRSRSVPVPNTPTSSIEVKDKDAAFKLVNPVPITERSVDMGHRLFSIYCVPCHGKSGTGDGYVGQKLILQPWNLTSSNTIHSWNSPDYPDGYIFGMMTFGGAVMPVYAIDLSPTERWEVIDYIRAVLQKRGIPAVASSAQNSK